MKFRKSGFLYFFRAVIIFLLFGGFFGLFRFERYLFSTVLLFGRVVIV